MRLVFCGTDDFCVPTLSALFDNFFVAAVVTEPDRPSGRGLKIVASRPKQMAIEHGVPCLQPEKLVGNKEFIGELKKINPDVIVVAAYGQFLPNELLELPKYGCLNVHPSLLPKFRGPSPIQSALLNDDKSTGVTIIKLNSKMDAGDIVGQVESPIDEDDDYFSMEKKLSELGARLLVESLPKYVAEKIVLRKQDDSAATICRIIKKEDAIIDWNESAVSIANKVRAFVKWPVASTKFLGKKLEIIKAQPMLLSVEKKYKVGEVFDCLNKKCVQCGDGALQLEKVKLEGKRETPVNDFVNGHQNFVGTILG
ncbi:MAG: methionyl-tRNA formyltransferase [Parcubacteria group bacterium]